MKKRVLMLMQATVEQLTKEKWELSAANTDLQQRLQQTVTLAHMQVGNINLQFAHLNVSSNCSPNTLLTNCSVLGIPVHCKHSCHVSAAAVSNAFE